MRFLHILEAIRRPLMITTCQASGMHWTAVHSMAKRRAPPVHMEASLDSKLGSSKVLLISDSSAKHCLQANDELWRVKMALSVTENRIEENQKSVNHCLDGHT